MEHIWNPFFTFCVIALIAGVLFELLNIWRIYAARPKCKCTHTTKDKS